MENYLGEIRIFGATYAPEGWHICDGTLLSVNDNQALFSVLGVTYGGDGMTTFGVPDLRGRLVVGAGTGAGLTARLVGQTGGSETATVSTAQMPAHTHSYFAAPAVASANIPGSALLQGTIDNGVQYLKSNSSGATADLLATTSIGLTGQGQPHANVMPGMVVNYIIATQGIYPTPAQ